MFQSEFKKSSISCSALVEFTHSLHSLETSSKQINRDVGRTEILILDLEDLWNSETMINMKSSNVWLAKLVSEKYYTFNESNIRSIVPVKANLQCVIGSNQLVESTCSSNLVSLAQLTNVGAILAFTRCDISCMLQVVTTNCIVWIGL